MATSTGTVDAPSLLRRAFSWPSVTIVVVALVVAVAAVVYAVTKKSNTTSSRGNRSASTPTRSLDAGKLKVGAPQILSAGALVSFAKASPGPIYWAGPAGVGARLEVTATTDGNVFVRYLTGTATAGDPRSIFTTIGTYGLTHAYKVVSADGVAKGAKRLSVPGGGIAETSAKTPHSYYVAFPRSNYVVEVYAKSPAHARALVLSGTIVPVG